MCGIVAVTGERKAIELAVIGAHQLQNRARTYAGGVSCDGHNMYRHAGKGLAREVFTTRPLTHLHGLDAIVHIRYPTGSDDDEKYDNTQPILGIYSGRQFALAHNGTLTNTDELRRMLPSNWPLTTSIDTEIIVRLIERWQTGDIKADLTRVFGVLRGSFCLVILFNDLLVAVRDKSGNHPLSVGKLETGYCVASENSAFATMQAERLFDVEAGTMVFIKNGKGPVVHKFAEKAERRCAFELLYNSSPASTIFGLSVARFRERAGYALADLFSGDDRFDTIVTPVPDSGLFFAIGLASHKNGGTMRQVIFRNHYVGRTFNAATQGKRDEEVSRKFIFDPEEIKGKRVVVVDDSIVRGTTIPKIVRVLKRLGAEEVHLRIGTPPITEVCRYGIYMDEDDTDLIARGKTSEELAALFGATSLEYLPLEMLKKLLPDPENYCFACMGGAFW